MGDKREAPAAAARRDGSAETRKKGKVSRAAGWVVSLPLRHFPKDEIASNAVLIKSLFAALKRRPDRGGGVRVREGRAFDLEATAFDQGVSVRQIECLLAQRQRFTARTAYVAFTLGWLFFGAWAYRLYTMQWSPGVALPAIEFAPLCAAPFLYAFKAALQNYQIRMRRLATPREYLNTTESFWPR